MDRTAAHWAAGNGSYEALKKLQQLGADLLKKDMYGMTPLLWASWYGQIRCVIMLTKVYKEKVVDRNKKRMNLLHCAALNDHEHVVEYVGDCLMGFNINAKDIKGWTALHMACDKGFTGTVKMLLRFNPKVDIADKTGCTPIHYVCKNGNEEIIQALIKAGSSVCLQNEDGLTPLHYAVKHDKIQVVKILLKNLQAEELNIPSHLGDTALVAAAVNGKKKVLMLLLRHPGINVNVQDNYGNTVIHKCCRRTPNSAAVVSAIINTGRADVNLANERRDLAIHAAIEYNDPVIVSLLVHAGSSLYDNTKYGNSPLSLAVKSGSDSCVDAIVKGQRIIQLSGNKAYFKEHFKPRLSQDSELSNYSDKDESIVAFGYSGNTNDVGDADINDLGGNNDDDGTNTIIGDDDEELNMRSDDDDDDDDDKRLKDNLIKTAVDEEDKTSDILEDYKSRDNGNGSRTDRRRSIASVLSSISSASFNSIEEMHQVRNNLLQNLSYLKEHNKIIPQNLGSFDELDEETDEVSRRFQDDLNTVLKQMGDEDFGPHGSVLKDSISQEGPHDGSDEDDRVSIKHESVSMFGGSSHGSLDLELFDPFDKISNASEETLSREEEEEDQALIMKMREVLWKVANKKMKKEEWVELAKHWEFPRVHIQAIKHFQTSSKSYKSNSYRLLTIWLECFRQLKPTESPVKEVYEAFIAIENKPLADKFLSNMTRNECKKEKAPKEKKIEPKKEKAPKEKKIKLIKEKAPPKEKKIEQKKEKAPPKERKKESKKGFLRSPFSIIKQKINLTENILVIDAARRSKTTRETDEERGGVGEERGGNGEEERGGDGEETTNEPIPQLSIINDREGEITDQEDAISGKEDAISGKEDTIDGKEDTIDGKEDTIDGKEDTIDGKEDIIDGKEDTIDSKEDTIDGKEDTIDGKEDTIDGKEDTIDGKEDTIDGKEDAIDGKEDIIDGKQGIINDSQSIINDDKESFSNRKDSNSDINDSTNIIDDKKEGKINTEVVINNEKDSVRETENSIKETNESIKDENNEIEGLQKSD